MSATGSPSPAPAGLDEIPAPRLACAFSVASAKPPALPCWYSPPAGGGRRRSQKLAGMRLAPWARHSSDPAGVPSRSAPKVTEFFCFEEERREELEEQEQPERQQGVLEQGEQTYLSDS